MVHPALSPAQLRARSPGYHACQVSGNGCRRILLQSLDEHVTGLIDGVA
jgi:hypothetical protein